MSKRTYIKRSSQAAARQTDTASTHQNLERLCRALNWVQSHTPSGWPQQHPLPRLSSGNSSHRGNHGQNVHSREGRGVRRLWVPRSSSWVTWRSHVLHHLLWQAWKMLGTGTLPLQAPRTCFFLSVSPIHLAVCCCCSVAQLCPTLWDPMDYSTPGFPVSQSLLRLTSIESVMPSSHLILCLPLLLLPSIFPSIRVFSDEPALDIGKVTGTAQKNIKKKTPGFCMDSQKWETPRKLENTREIV